MLLDSFLRGNAVKHLIRLEYQYLHLIFVLCLR